MPKLKRENVSLALKNKPVYVLEWEEVVAELGSVYPAGLDPKEAALRLAKHGLNEFEGKSGPSALKIFLRALLNAMNAVLLIAFIFSCVVQDWIEAGVLGAIIVINTGISFFQDYRSEKTMEALRKFSSPSAKVFRGGKVEVIPATSVVVGDIIQLAEGDQVAADCRLIEAVQLEADEALLTGENLPVDKYVEAVSEHHIPLGDRRNMVFKGTFVTKGRGVAVVTSTGMKTQIGTIAESVQEQGSAGKTQLQRQMNYLMFFLLACAILLALVVFGANKFVFSNDAVLYAMAVSVAIIPEGLPAVVTVTMAVGVRRMAQANAIVRKLTSLEALSQVTNICSDKTGTLTVGKMTATEVWTTKDSYVASGEGLNPAGKVTRVVAGEMKEVVTAKNLPEALDWLAQCCALCNTSNLLEKDGTWTSTGDPTEVALLVLARKLERSRESLEKEVEYVAEFPFDATIKRMTTIVSRKADSSLCFLSKGSIESILSCSTHYIDKETGAVAITEEFSNHTIRQMESLASRGLRVLGFGYRVSKEATQETFEEEDRPKVESNFTFLGMVGMIDPPRAQSAPSVEECHTAGITVHMATGDHAGTAAAIAQKIGILPKENPGKLVMEAKDFDLLTDDEIDQLPELPRVLARCSPESKVKLIKALHRRNKICAMTGDGVNDAPAIKKADIGIVMGMSGSDVTKQASDIILTDDNFSTIVMAIAEGRQIFVNIGKFTLHLLTSNVAQVVCLIIGLAFIDLDGRSIYPMSPTQILWMNLITCAPPALLLGVDPASKDNMRKPSRGKNKGLFSKELIVDTFFYGTLMGILCLVSFLVAVLVDGSFDTRNCNHNFDSEGCDVIFQARGATFASMSLLLLIHALNCRSDRRSMFTMDHRKNTKLVLSVVGGIVILFPLIYIPYLNTVIFHHAPLSWEWGLVFASVVIFQVSVEFYKLAKRHLLRQPPKCE